MTLATIGGAGGILLGFWLRGAFVSLYSLESEGGREFYDLRLDWRIWLFCAAAALSTGVLFGLLPALRAVRCDMNGDLKSGGGAIGSPQGGRLRDSLATAQVSLSLVLVIAAGLMVHSAQQLL